MDRSRAWSQEGHIKTQGPARGLGGGQHDERKEPGSSPGLWGPGDGMNIHPLLGLCPRWILIQRPEPSLGSHRDREL